jgi:tetraacyldisaccharide 4'-kinase
VTFAERLVADWYAPRLTALTAAMLPLSVVYCGVVSLRRALFKQAVLSSTRLPVPVVIAGNIAVGGTGKTPLVIALARALGGRGWHPGLLSRGYGARDEAVREVTQDAGADDVGDEPLLLARTGFPVFVGAKRAAAARALLAAHPRCDVLLCDDGLQHYALDRDVEIVTVDSTRGMGNGLVLPAGPLREPVSRLAGVDAIVRQGSGHVPRGSREFVMRLVGDRFVRVNDEGITAGAEAFRSGGVHAVAGIGNPARFFADLRAHGITATCHAFPDHHRYSAADFDFAGASAILMTEKDAVKCKSFADDRFWSLPVEAIIDPALIALVEEKVRGSQVARDTGVPRHQGSADL